MREVIFYLAMIIEIAYVFMSQVPKKLENKYLLIGTAFICGLIVIQDSIPAILDKCKS